MRFAFDGKGRWLRFVANLALAAGLLLWIFARQVGGHAHAWLDAVIGLLIGLSIGMNLMLVWKSRTCRRTAPGL